MTAVEFLIEQICGEHTNAWKEEIEQALEMEKQQIEKAKDEGYDDLYITFEDYDSICSDGCCHDYGTITTLNGIELECHNQDTESILMQILLHLNYNVTIEYK
jgi:hypothetical protein